MIHTKYNKEMGVIEFFKLGNPQQPPWNMICEEIVVKEKLNIWILWEEHFR